MPLEFLWYLRLPWVAEHLALGWHENRGLVNTKTPTISKRQPENKKAASAKPQKQEGKKKKQVYFPKYLDF